MVLMMMSVVQGVMAQTHILPEGIRDRLAQREVLPGLQPPADTRCIMSVGSTEINYGIQSRGQLQDVPEGHNLLTPGRRVLALSVLCPTERQMSLALRGMTSTGGELLYGTDGKVLLRLSDVTVDNQKVMLTTVYSDEKQGADSSEQLSLKPGQKVMAVKNGKAVVGKALTASLEIVPLLSDHSTRVATQSRSEAYFALELQG
ncbi:hypothetical protein F518_04178 [Serratia marcescens VGH107]|nr:hypothetical protein F518_04178 [Serratia marcescens VGH107]